MKNSNPCALLFIDTAYYMTNVLFRPNETPHKNGVMQAYENLSDDNPRDVTIDKSKIFVVEGCEL